MSNQDLKDSSELSSIAVILPTYNRAHTLERAVRSVLAQSFRQWQLVIVDDGSIDSTAQLLERLTDPRILVVSVSHQGAAEARNIGVRAATAPFVTFLDSDDEALPEWLERLNYAFHEQDADIVTTGFEIVREDGRSDTFGLRDMGPLFDGVRANIVFSGTWAVRRAIFEQVGGFTKGMPASQHTEVAFRLLPAAQRNGWSIVGIESPLIRHYAKSPDGIREDDGAVLAGAEFLIKEYGEMIRQRDPGRLANHHSVAGFRSARLGERARARRHFLAALRYGRPTFKSVGRLILSLIWPLRPASWRRSHPA